MAQVIMNEATWANIVNMVRLKTGLSRDLVAGDLAAALQKIDVIGLPQFTARATLVAVPYQAISVPVCEVIVPDNIRTAEATLTLN